MAQSVATAGRRPPNGRTEVARQNLSDQVVLTLATEIARGDLAPGDPIPPESELALSFGVSKPTVREAIRALVALGLVHAQQGKRTVVHAHTSWNVLDPTVQEAFRRGGRGAELSDQLFELRMILETSSAARAAERASAEEVTKLRALIEELASIAGQEQQDLDAFLAVDREFHDLVAQASGNEVLRQVIRQVHGDLAIAWSTASITVEDLDLLVGMHAAITDAIAAGDAERAGEAMREHLEMAATRK